MANKWKALLIGLLAVAAVAWIAVQTEEPSVTAISALWAESGHANAGAPAFTNWNDGGSIPANCSKCHSLYAFLDFAGEDGSAAGTVERSANVGSVLYCNTCHNSSVAAMTDVTFPSTARIGGLHEEAVCMQCHQGLTSSLDVLQSTVGLPEDVASEELQMMDPHYLVGAATKMGNLALGAFQYDEREYDGFFGHATNWSTCTQCHDPHSLAISARACGTCHSNVSQQSDIRDIRESHVDYDGDGDTSEGIAGEINGMSAALLAAVQQYARDVLDAPMAYDPLTPPYFFHDTNGDGQVSSEEAAFGNRYDRWSPRLVRAVYNLQFVRSDPGAFAHNPRYILQVLYDSLADLAEQAPVDMAGMVRP